MNRITAVALTLFFTASWGATLTAQLHRAAHRRYRVNPALRLPASETAPMASGANRSPAAIAPAARSAEEEATRLLSKLNSSWDELGQLVTLEKLEAGGPTATIDALDFVDNKQTFIQAAQAAASGGDVASIKKLIEENVPPNKISKQIAELLNKNDGALRLKLIENSPELARVYAAHVEIANRGMLNFFKPNSDKLAATWMREAIEKAAQAGKDVPVKLIQTMALQEKALGEKGFAQWLVKLQKEHEGMNLVGVLDGMRGQLHKDQVKVIDELIKKTKGGERFRAVVSPTTPAAASAPGAATASLAPFKIPYINPTGGANCFLGDFYKFAGGVRTP